MRYNSSESGRSMIEMLGVLAIVGILSTGGISAYSNAMAKHKVNKTTDQLTQVSFNIRNAFLSQRNYNGVQNLDSLIALNVFPQEMIYEEARQDPVLRAAPQTGKKFDDSSLRDLREAKKISDKLLDYKLDYKEIKSIETIQAKGSEEMKKIVLEDEYKTAKKKAIDASKEMKKYEYAKEEQFTEEKKIREDQLVKALPSMPETVTTIKHAFSDYVNVYLADKNSENDKGAFVLSFSGLPAKACTSLVTEHWTNDEGLISVSINSKDDLTSHTCEASESVFCENENITVSDITNACNSESNYIAFKYY